MSERARLDATMRDLLAQLSTISHVPAAPWQPTGRSRSSDEPLGGSRPPGDLGEAQFARAYGPPFNEPTPRHPGCTTDAERAAVIADAKEELKHIRGHYERNVAGETLAERDERIVTEYEGLPAHEAAFRARCGVRDVHRAREARGRERDDGRQPESDLDPEVRRARALELADEGFSIAYIARRLEVPRSVVARDLGRWAA